MPVSLKGQPKPSDFNIRSHLVGSPLNKCEKEIVARNIIVISLQNNDTWFDFTFDDYKAHCAPRIDFNGEEACLDALAQENGILDKKGTIYSVNAKFFKVLAKFIKTPRTVER
jgi:hypothetical protein